MRAAGLENGQVCGDGAGFCELQLFGVRPVFAAIPDDFVGVADAGMKAADQHDGLVSEDWQHVRLVAESISASPIRSPVIAL